MYSFCKKMYSEKKLICSLDVGEFAFVRDLAEGESTTSSGRISLLSFSATCIRLSFIFKRSAARSHARHPIQADRVERENYATTRLQCVFVTSRLMSVALTLLTYEIAKSKISF